MRQPRFFTAVFLLLATITSAGFASDILSLVRENYGANASFSSEFTMTTFWAIREKEETKSGSISLAPGDRFRVAIGQELVVSDGTTAWHRSGDQVVIRRLEDLDLSVMRLFTSYLDSCPFAVTQQENAAKLSWARQESDSAGLGTVYDSMRVTVLKKDGSITTATMVDRNGNRFTYEFNKTRLGKSFDPETFVFDIPNWARVVDMRD